MKIEEPNTIISQRIFHYPCALVFRAWEDGTHLAKWFGPKGFRNTFETFEFRSGGEWKFVMHGPDGTDYPNRSVFKEIIPDQKIVFDHVVPPEFLATVLFETSDGKTKLTYKMLCKTEQIYNALKGFCPEKNEENFDRLEAELAVMVKNK